MLGSVEDLERRILALERQIDALRHHGLEHEINGRDPLRPSVMYAGTRLARHREINFTNGLAAAANTAEKRIDVTLAPNLVEQRCTANTTSTSATPADLTGAAITVNVSANSAALVLGSFYCGSSVGLDIFGGYLDVDGTDEGAVAVGRLAASETATMHQVWLVPLAAAGNHTFKLQGARVSGTGTVTFYATHTKLIVLVLGDTNITNDTSS